MRLIIRQLGIRPYLQTYHAMREFTEQREAAANDEIWILQHEPVFTQGMNGQAKHILREFEIPVVATDRGGQVTYHGPGQLIIYFLLDLKRLQSGVRTLVNRLEESVIQTLMAQKINATRRKGAPGVYVQEKKISALGVRVKRGCCYHGISLNVDMDLNPFSMINPCGYANLELTQVSDFCRKPDMNELAEHIIEHFMNLYQKPYATIATEISESECSHSQVA